MLVMLVLRTGKEEAAQKVPLPYYNVITMLQTKKIIEADINFQKVGLGTHTFTKTK